MTLAAAATPFTYLDSLEDAAHDYAERGWPVLVTVGKHPLTRWKKGDERQRATKSHLVIQDWFFELDRQIDSLAIATGAESGFVVLDCDPQNGGDIAQLPGEIPTTLTARTPKGGAHYFFEFEAGLTNGRGSLPGGFDFRGEGGLVVAAPSFNPRVGGSYEWVNWGTPPAEVPDWLLRVLGTRQPPTAADPARGQVGPPTERDVRHAEAALAKECDRLAGLKEGTEGGRNNALNVAALRLFRMANAGTLDHDEVRRRLGKAGQACGLKRPEVVATLKSARQAADSMPPTVGPDAQEGKFADEGVIAEKKPTLVKIVSDFVAEHYDLFRTPEGQAFALPKTGLRLPVVFPETGGSLTADVRMRLDDAGTTVGKNTVQDAMGIVHARALSRGTRAPLHLRCQSDSDRVVIDLCESDSTRCVVVSAQGWELKDEPPPGVYFRRSRGMEPLPAPSRPRKPGQGWKVLSEILDWKRSSREFLLIRGWLAVACMVHLQRPMPIFVGAPGSAKTSRGLTLINVWDPRPGLGSSFGKNIDDDRVKANASFLVGYDNLSTVSEAQSDHIARLVTGEATDKRQLYSDDTVHTMAYRRSGILTAVNLPTGFKPDAMERLIPLEFNRLRDFGSETTLKNRTQAVQPMILADALDDVVAVLAGLPRLYIDEPANNVRMKDYWLALLALGQQFADAYEQHSREGMLEIARADPWVRSFEKWAAGLDGGAFKGSPDEMFSAYADFYLGDENDENLPEARRPKSANSLSRMIKENATPLQAAGVHAELTRSNGLRIWTVVYDAQ